MAQTGHLILTRTLNQSFVIGDDIEVRVEEVCGDRVRLGIMAPTHVSVYRKEVHEARKTTERAARRGGLE